MSDDKVEKAAATITAQANEIERLKADNAWLLAEVNTVLAESDKQAATIAEMRKALKECADDLEAELLAKEG